MLVWAFGQVCNCQVSQAKHPSRVYVWVYGITAISYVRALQPAVLLLILQVVWIKTCGGATRLAEVTRTKHCLPGMSQCPVEAETSAVCLAFHLEKLVMITNIIPLQWCISAQALLGTLLGSGDKLQIVSHLICSYWLLCVLIFIQFKIISLLFYHIISINHLSLAFWHFYHSYWVIPIDASHLREDICKLSF